MKTIVHYKNGQRYTVNHLFICCTEWTGDDIKVYGELWPDLSASEVKGFVDTFKGVLFLEEVSKEDGVVKLHFSPDVDMSAKVDIMTAKQRSKANQSRWDVEHMKAIELSVTGADRFFELLDNPPPINEKLLAAAKKYKKREV